jgi:peptidoglycan-associated lipoprotein
LGSGNFPTNGAAGLADGAAGTAGGMAGRDPNAVPADPSLRGGAGQWGVGESFVGESMPAGVEDPNLGPVQFAYDSDSLTAEASETLVRHAKYLASRPELQVVVRGHADEQGTDEYNLALGSRRALAVRERLITLGIDGARLHTLSLGENEPLDTSGTEAANAKNRRVDFRVYTN